MSMSGTTSKMHCRRADQVGAVALRAGSEQQRDQRVAAARAGHVQSGATILQKMV
jgi:hypothetical protein